MKNIQAKNELLSNVKKTKSFLFLNPFEYFYNEVPLILHQYSDWAGSFEKYLFQKAFELYEDTFVHTFSFGLSRYECNEKKILEESCKTCFSRNAFLLPRVRFCRSYFRLL